MPIPNTPRGMYFEEFAVGQKVLTDGRTIGEHDILGFAGLSGDFNTIHTDAEFARTTPFGQRIAHGLLVLSIVSGLAVKTGIVDGTILAFREVSEWKFSKPVFIGDTIHAEVEVTETKPIPRLGGGSVTLRVVVKNQSNDTVQTGTWVFLVLSRPKA